VKFQEHVTPCGNSGAHFGNIHFSINRLCGRESSHEREMLNSLRDLICRRKLGRKKFAAVGSRPIHCRSTGKKQNTIKCRQQHQSVKRVSVHCTSSPTRSEPNGESIGTITTDKLKRCHPVTSGWQQEQRRHKIGGWHPGI
jgi:hypothetical protein